MGQLQRHVNGRKQPFEENTTNLVEHDATPGVDKTTFTNTLMGGWESPEWVASIDLSYNKQNSKTNRARRTHITSYDLFSACNKQSICDNSRVAGAGSTCVIAKHSSTTR